MRRTRPCKDCTKRYPACQDTCKDLAASLAEDQREKEAKKLYRTNIDIAIESIKRLKKRRLKQP